VARRHYQRQLDDLRQDVLAVLIDRPVEICPLPTDPTIRFIHPSAPTHWSSRRARRRLETGEKVLPPAVGGAPIDQHTTLGEPFDDIGIPQPVADVLTLSANMGCH